MPVLVLDILRFVFLAVLWIFVARAVKVIYLELKPAAPRRATQGRSSGPAPRQPSPRRAKKAPRKLSVIEGDSLRGKSFDLSDELIIGRADRCHLVLDDTYVSQVHARVFSKGEAFMVEDMGSTNGTYLNKRRLTAPAELQRGDRVKIGKTILEMRK